MRKNRRTISVKLEKGEEKKDWEEEEDEGKGQITTSDYGMGRERKRERGGWERGRN